VSFLRVMHEAAQSILHMGVDESEQTCLLTAMKGLHECAVLLDHLVRPLVGALEGSRPSRIVDNPTGSILVARMLGAALDRCLQEGEDC
jgi:hypothetical protein